MKRASTYALLIAGPLLARFKIHLSHDALSAALSEESRVIPQLLHVPVLNIYNGIIFQQAYDYQVYLQKLLIDYRLSVENGKDKESPGAGTRNDLDDYFDQTNKLVNELNTEQYNHYQLIAKSQAWLIEKTKSSKNPLDDLTALFESKDFAENLAEFVTTAEQLSRTFTNYSQQFYDLILTTSSSLRLLADYRLDEQQIESALEGIMFDPISAGSN